MADEIVCYTIYRSENHKNNNSNLFYRYSVGVEIFFGPLWACIFSIAAFVVIFCNILLAVTLKKVYKNRLTLSQKLYIYLSITDIFTGCSFPCYLAINSFSPKWVCLAWGIFATLIVYFYGLGWGTFLIISLMRHMAIRKPLENSFLTTRVVKILLVCWNSYMVYKGGMTFFVNTQFFNSYELTLSYWIIVGSLMFLEVVFLLAVNCSSAYYLRDKPHQKTTDIHNLRIRIRNRNAVTTVLLISVIYVI